MVQTAPSSASAVLDLAQAGPPLLGRGRLVLLDGPAGSGKTTLAEAIGRLAGAPVLHTDDLLAGWDGLPGLAETLGLLLAPLAEGRPGSAPRYDWHAGRYDGHVVQDPVELLLIEGVGSGTLPAAGWATLLVWVEAPYELRMRRGIERDGDAFAPHWERWAAAEAALFSEHGTRDRADVVLDGTSGRPGSLRQ